MFGSRPPQKDRRGRFWDWINPALGRGVNCWIAGVLVGVETHWMGRTQPCRFYITGGRMKCYCSTSKLGTEWKGYVPLFDENGVQCFAIVGERYAEVASSIPLFSPVTVSRLKSAGAPVCVKQSTWTDSPPPSRGEQLRPKDIRPWLLKLWKDEALIEWFEKHGNEAEQPAAGSSRRGNVVPDAVRERQRAAAGNDLPPTIGDSLPRLPASNGKGKH